MLQIYSSITMFTVSVCNEQRCNRDEFALGIVLPGSNGPGAACGCEDKVSRESSMNNEWFWCEKAVEILNIDCFKNVP